MDADSPLCLTLREAAAALRARKLSSVELTRLALARIAAVEPQLNAYVRTVETHALEVAGQADRELAAGHWRGELHGIPVAVKDLYDMAGVPTTCSSKVRAGHIADTDSACVERLEQAGAVIVGKTQMHEFAYGATTPQSGNAWNPACTPGGSSAGSAITVASRGAFMALGTDTGGSIRIPSSVNGIVGIKPTYGRVSRHGAVTLSWSLDHAGPLARTVGDVAVSLSALAGYDARDQGSADVPVGDYLSELEAGAKGLRLGVPRNYYFDHVQSEVEHNVRTAIDTLKAEGAELVDVDIPMADQIMPAEFAILMPEASAYHQAELRAHPELYQPDVRAFLEAGELIPAVDYVQALRVRTCIQQAWRRMFDDARIDAIVAPGVSAPAMARDQLDVPYRWPDGSEEPAINVFVRCAAPGNVTGLPAAVVPCGFSTAGLPTALQIVGRPFREARVLRIARAYERTTRWAQRLPPL